MSSLQPLPDGQFRLQFAYRCRHTIRLGGVAKAQAQIFQINLDSLLEQLRAGVPLDIPTRQWIDTLPKYRREQLAKWGLIDGTPHHTIAELVDRYASHSKNKGNKSSSLVSEHTNSRGLVSLAGADTDLGEITKDIAGQWAEQMGKTLSPATVSRRMRQYHAMFALAVELRWLERNPVPGGLKRHDVNADRHVYIPLADTEQCIQACECSQLRAVISLARHCGLRIPSETLGLTLSDVQADGTLFVDSPKTGPRTLPQFGAEPYLTVCHIEAAVGQELMFPNLNTSSQALRGHLTRLYKKVGIQCPPKPFINLRASAEADMYSAGYTIQQVTVWMGHSPAVALRHYNRIKESDSTIRAAAEHRARSSQ